MPVPFTGGCACGAIRYECSAEPLLTLKCHCRDCQRSSGSAYNVNVIIPAPALKFTKGDLMYYVLKVANGNTVSRGFCSACGSPMLSKVDTTPAFRGISAASLDDPSGLEPTADIWTSSAQPWDYLNPHSPKIETWPTAEEWQELLSS